MKKIIRYLPLLFVIVLAQGCVKTVPVYDVAPPVTGAWVLSESTRSTGGGWYYFTTGLENGVFNFYNHGAAKYDDGYSLMQGNWNIRTISAGYYDQYGNYYNDLHDTFEVHVYDSYTHGSVDLSFDDVVFTGSKIIATNYNGNSISRYVFRRY